MLTFIVHHLKSFIFFFVNLFKKSLCCFRRRKRSDAEPVVLTSVGVVPSFPPCNEEEAVIKWDNWGSAEVTVEDRIADFRRQQAAKLEPVEESPPPDYFIGMEPEIRKQARLFLKSKEESVDASNRLAFSPQTVIPNDGGELGSWEENTEERSAWAEADDWNGLIREKRRQDRQSKRPAVVANR